MCRKTILVGGFVCLFPLSEIPAMELVNRNPGTRATAMAGLFTAQANDSSAIWYNPAGIASPQSAQFDSTVSWSEYHAGASGYDGSYGPTDTILIQPKRNNINFAGVSSHGQVFAEKLTGIHGAALGYYNPYTLVLNIDEPVSAQSTQTFGRVEVKYQELLFGLSAGHGDDFSYGGSLEFMGTDIECLDFSICVDNGPWGIGLIAGALYSKQLNAKTQLNVAGVWRSKISLAYSNKPQSGVGSVLDQYLPDRPQSATIGVGFSVATSANLIQFNSEYAYKWWSETSGDKNPLSDYSEFGFSGEILQPLTLGFTLAVRIGLKQSDAVTGELHPDFNTYSTGLGVAISERHFLDTAYEKRDVKDGSYNSNLISASYSYQF